MDVFNCFTVFISVVSLHICSGYMEALAVHTDPNLNKFEPQVAFICNKPAMHRVVNGWEVDYTTDCLDNPEDILKYCKKMYPDHDVVNVIETTYKTDIPNWPKFEGPDPEKTATHKVTPFRCLVGDFESEALLVPQHCIFDHEHDSSKCDRPSVWIETASQECTTRSMVLESSGMLVVCGLDKFRGVEYVCCPKDAETNQTAESPSSASSAGSENVDDYTAYLRGYDLNKYDNEHEKFKAAEKLMQKSQHEKITKMMKEWQDAREHMAEMRKTDTQGAEQLNREITERFQRMYHAFEQEEDAEKKQLVSVHQQRVQADFNKKRRELMDAYKGELESDNPKSAKVLSYLKMYIRTEEKDRLHTVNHYEHLHDTDIEEAARVKDSLVKHLSLIDDRINASIEMLKRVPELDKEIRAEIDEFRQKKFRNLEITIDDDIPMQVKAEETDTKKNVETITENIKVAETPVQVVVQIADQDSADASTDEDHDYTNIHIDSEGMTQEEESNNKPALIQNAGMAVQQKSSFTADKTSSFSTGNFVGITIGSVAVFIIIIVAVVMLKKRNQQHQPITHGFVEVDPAASPEERHVTNMQMNGYENPTYRYFEMGTN